MSRPDHRPSIDMPIYGSEDNLMVVPHVARGQTLIAAHPAVEGERPRYSQFRVSGFGAEGVRLSNGTGEVTVDIDKLMRKGKIVTPRGSLMIMAIHDPELMTPESRARLERMQNGS